VRVESDQDHDPILHQQAQLLRLVYNYVAIQIHRPFIFKQSALSLASLAMSVNAARSCARVLQDFDMPSMCIPALQAAFCSAVILLLNIWGQKRNNSDPTKDLAAISTCMEFVKRHENKYYPMFLFSHSF
jgi:hypothetical protein